MLETWSGSNFKELVFLKIIFICVSKLHLFACYIQFIILFDNFVYILMILYSYIVVGNLL